MKKFIPALFLLAVTAKAQLFTNDTLVVRAILDSNGYYTTPANMVYSKGDYGINRVTILDFNSLSPLKCLPAEIGQLDQLRELSVVFDSSAIISSGISMLSNLKQLELTGWLHSVPPEIFKLPELVSLDLAGNLLDSLPDNIGDAKKLRYLNISWNHLQHLPSSIGELTSLQGLYLHNNNISILPTGIGTLDSLYSLNLSNNNLSVFPDEICDMENLISLYLSNNQLKNLPSGITKLRNLIDLNVSHNQLSSIPKSVDSLIALSALDISFNQLTELPLGFINLNLTPGAICGSNGCQTFEVLQIGSNLLCSLSGELSNFLDQCDADWKITQKCQLSVRKNTMESNSFSIRPSPGQAYDLFGRQIKTDTFKNVNNCRIAIIQSGKNTKKFLTGIH
jgi:hypothetical protein